MKKSTKMWLMYGIGGFLAWKFWSGRSASPVSSAEPSQPGVEGFYGYTALGGLGHCPTRITTTSGIVSSPQGGSRSRDSQGSTMSVKPQGSHNIGHTVSPSQCCLTPGLRMPGGLGLYA